MNPSERKFKLTNEIGLEELNPYNVALKNDYLDNLLTTAFSVIPNIYPVIGYPIIIKRAFCSYRLMQNDHKPETPHLIEKYTQGLGIRITWDQWDFHVAKEAANAVYANIPGNMHIVINNDEKHISFYFNMHDRLICEALPDQEIRIIRK